MIRFTWDEWKRAKNFVKHGVTFDEAIEALCDELAKTELDVAQPAEERRFISVGESRRGRVLTVGFADYGDEARIITARMATRKERREYEES